MSILIPTSWQPHGLALKAYWKGNKKAVIDIHMDDESVTSMPIEIYFRTREELPEIEKIALPLCKGKTLDVGAGAGAHCLALQEHGIDVTGLDISPDGVEIMQLRGVKKTVCQDFLKYYPTEAFDTLLFLMNGIGIAGNLPQLEEYLRHAHSVTTAEGQIILDSSDLTFTELELDFDQEYHGVFNYQLSFEGQIGSTYQWLYIDQEKLTEVAEKNNWLCEIIYEQEDGGFLARLTKA